MLLLLFILLWNYIMCLLRYTTQLVSATGSKHLNLLFQLAEKSISYEKLWEQVFPYFQAT